MTDLLDVRLDLADVVRNRPEVDTWDVEAATGRASGGQGCSRAGTGGTEVCENRQSGSETGINPGAIEGRV